MDWGVIESIVVTAYTVWKWRVEYQDRKEKEHIKDKQAKQKSKKCSNR